MIKSLKLCKITSWLIIINLIVIFFSYSESNSDGYNFTYSLEVYLPYEWNEIGLRVATLQHALNVPITGKYDAATRNAHISFLNILGAPNNNVPDKPISNKAITGQVVVDSQLCGGEEFRNFAHLLLDKYNIKIPNIYLLSNDKGFYGPNSDAIFLPKCETKSAVAHELGHYVHAKAFGLVWDAAAADAAVNFTHSDWIVSEEVSPGVEHAAHCIGNVLWGYGVWTKCPDAIMKNHAKEIIVLASNS